MSSIRHRRVAAVVVSALLGLMLIGTGVASARPPGWAITTHATPPEVVHGADAGWVVTVANGGKSNISSVLVITDIPTDDPLVNPVPTYVSGATWAGQAGPANPCTAAFSGPLFCDFGNIVAGGSVKVTVAFETPAGGASWAFKFLGFGNGNTPSDGDNNASHGDFAEGPASVALTTDKNFAGKFSLDGAVIADSSDLGPKNIQFSSLLPPGQNLGVSLEDGLANDTFSCPDSIPQCGNAFGEWTRLYVDNGATFPNGIKVVTTILGNKVPSGATVLTIDLIHVNDADEADVISNRCDNAAGGLDPDANNDGFGEECIIVTKAGNIFQIEAWLLNNGGNRTSY